MYRVANADEYLVKTGFGVGDIKILRKGFLFFGQRLSRISMIPENYTLNLQAMTIEKLQFTLPASFTIGPKDTPEALQKYCKLLAGHGSKTKEHIGDLVRGIVEGETRVIAAGMTIEEIFKERTMFKDHVMKRRVCKKSCLSLE